MKLSKLFLMGAVVLGLGLTACNNEDGPEVGQKDNSFAGLTLSTRNASGLRATQADENGRTAESKVVLIDLLSSAEPKTWGTAGTASPATYPVNTAQFFDLTGGKYTVSPWSTTDGTHTMALLLNGGGLASKGTIATADTMEVTDAVSVLAAEDAFVMTSKTFSGNVLPNISEATIASPTNTANVFDQNVERVVAQGIVTDGTSTKTTTDNTGTLSELKYGGAMGATKTYLYANNAGDRVMTGSPLDYQGYTSAVHTEAIETTEPSTNANFAKAELTDLALATEASPYAARGFYFLENSMALPDSNLDWKFTRSAYAKVYGVFTPTTVYTFDTWKFHPQQGTGEYYDPVTGLPKAQAEGGEEGYLTGTLKTTTITAGTTFFKGEKDGLFYDSSSAAKLSTTYPNQKSYMYEDGKVVYRTLWNRVMDDAGTKTLNGNTRRNNIYVLKVTEFSKIGMNYDPNDPNDPNIPKPNNPDEPITPPDGGDPTVDKQETHMRVTATILPWNKVSRDVVL